MATQWGASGSTAKVVNDAGWTHGNSIWRAGTTGATENESNTPSEMVKIDITLRGEKADCWVEIIDDMTEDLGYQPSRPEALGLLMAKYTNDQHLYTER